MIPLKFHNLETRQKITVPVEDTITMQLLLRKFRDDGVIGSGPCHVTDLTGKIVPPDSVFRNISAREFFINPGMTPATPSCRQLGIFVIDGSGSMVTGKVKGNLLPAEAVDEALRATIKRIQNSTKKACFMFSVVAFGDIAKIMLPNTNVAEISEVNSKVNSFNPAMLYEGGAGSKSTSIASGLTVAYELAGKFLNGKDEGLIRKAAIIVLSDGMCHHESETRAMADKIKQLPGAQICCCHLETGAHETDAVRLLKDICSNSLSDYQTVYDEETIREFFIKSATKVAG
jgi:Mg-chelatase subunit ChlD